MSGLLATKWVGLWFVLGFSPANHAAYSKVGSLNEAVKAVRAAVFGVLRPQKYSQVTSPRKKAPSSISMYTGKLCRFVYSCCRFFDYCCRFLDSPMVALPSSSVYM